MTEIGERVVRALGKLAESTTELRDLDAAIGDGDLGITVGKGAAAVTEAIGGLGGPATVADVLRAAGRAFASANPSTMAALVGGALLRAARAVGDAKDADRATSIMIVRAAAQSIAERGKSQVGEKTILDALCPAADALERSGDASARQALEAMAQAAADGVELTRELQSQRGRAAWTREQSIGHPDPGAVACLRFIEALRDSWE